MHIRIALYLYIYFIFFLINKGGMRTCIKKYKNLDISTFLTILKVENYAYTHNTPQKHPKKGQNYAYMHMHVRIILLNSMHIRIFFSKIMHMRIEKQQNLCIYA